MKRSSRRGSRRRKRRKRRKGDGCDLDAFVARRVREQRGSTTGRRTIALAKEHAAELGEAIGWIVKDVENCSAFVRPQLHGVELTLNASLDSASRRHCRSVRVAVQLECQPASIVVADRYARQTDHHASRISRVQLMPKRPTRYRDRYPLGMTS